MKSMVAISLYDVKVARGCQIQGLEVADNHHPMAPFTFTVKEQVVA